MFKHYKSIKLILRDQLNELNPWFNEDDDNVLFVLMEVQSVMDYVKHHTQKVEAILKTWAKLTQLNFIGQ